MNDTKEKSCESRIDEQLENLEESVIHPLEHYYDLKHNMCLKKNYYKLLQVWIPFY